MDIVATGPGKPTPHSGLADRRLLVALLAAVAAVVMASALRGQSSDTSYVEQLLRNSATGVVLPQTPLQTDAVIRARSAATWRAGSDHRLLLEDEVSFDIGGYGFKARRAVVFITPRHVHSGRVYELAIYLDDVTEWGGHGPIQAQASRLLVTAVVKGEVVLRTDQLQRRSADGQALVRDAAERVNRYRRAQAERIVALGKTSPLYESDVLARQQGRAPDTSVDTTAAPARRAEPSARAPAPAAPAETQPQADRAEPPAEPPVEPDVIEQLQRVQFRADKVIYQELEGEGAAILMGNVQVMHHDPGADRSMSLSADRAVLFTAPGALTGDQALDAQTVRGVYLEDNVLATDGQYTLRGPRMFFDIQSQRAIVLDAVFYTWDIERQVPIYVRARKLMQVSKDQWRAEKARLSTSEFHEPHFALGINQLTVEREEEDDDRTVYNYDARGATFRVGEMPVFYWPRFAGEAGDTPLRRASVSFDTQDGVVIESRWDAFALAGVDRPEGVNASFRLDGFTRRGVGGGYEMDYDVPKAFGNVLAYGMYDTGEDEPGGRDEVDPDTETRGLVHWQHRHLLPDDWEVSAEVSYISDPTFLEEFFESQAYRDKPWETSLYIKKQTDDWAFTFLTRYDLLDFVPQLPQLQTPGYTVDKLPELAYYRIGTPLFGDLVTWFSENRASMVSLNFPEQAPRELGFNAAESLAIFGMARTRSLGVALRGSGLTDGAVGRFDTRQELNMPLKLGPIDVVPYVVGRATVYDDDFASFRGETDSARLWGQAGVKLHTSLTRTYDSVESRLLDLHRLRHNIEPFININYADTNIEQQFLPVFDFDVESLSEGFVTRLGVRNTWQTQRGGPGRWRSVDVFRLDTEFVIQDEDTVRESPIGRFFGYRPEFSMAGDHFYTEMAWQVTDTFHTAANLNYSFDTSEVERWNASMTLDHNPRLSSFAELRHISDLDTLILRYGFDYLLSAKYHLSFSQSFDFDREEVRDLNVTLTRRLPRMLFEITASVDEVGDVSSIGVALVPEGGGGRGQPAANPFIYTR